MHIRTAAGSRAPIAGRASAYIPSRGKAPCVHGHAAPPRPPAGVRWLARVVRQLSFLRKGRQHLPSPQSWLALGAQRRSETTGPVGLSGITQLPTYPAERSVENMHAPFKNASFTAPLVVRSVLAMTTKL